MKKKTISLILALALCFGLSAPARAADAAGPALLETDLAPLPEDQDPNILWDVELKLRGIDWEGTYDGGSDEPSGAVGTWRDVQTYPSETLDLLPLGVTLTSHAQRCTIIAYYPPDRDGVRTLIYHIRENVGGYCEFRYIRPDEPGPWTLSYEPWDEGWANYLLVRGDNFLDFGFNDHWSGQQDTPSCGARLSSGFLTDFFGAGTLVQITLADHGGQTTAEDETYLFLLTGEPVDTSLLTNGAGRSVTPYGAVAHGWAAADIARAEEEGLVPDPLAGTDLTGKITRAQFASVAVRLYEAFLGGEDEYDYGIPFTDVGERDDMLNDPDAYHTDICKAYHWGIVNGVSATSFAPDSLVTREQAATMLARVYQKLGMTVPSAAATGFADDGAVSGWAKDAVAYMAGRGIVKGVSADRFVPKDDLTVEQALIMALRMFENGLG